MSFCRLFQAEKSLDEGEEEGEGFAATSDSLFLMLGFCIHKFHGAEIHIPRRQRPCFLGNAVS